jgi:hypothetical protein
MRNVSAAPPVGQAVEEALQDGRRLYRRFNRFPAERSRRVRHNRLMPPVAVELGELAGIIYRSDKWQPGQPRTYIHFMEDPPRLVSNVDGSQLYIVGGSYRVTGRGIEG